MRWVARIAILGLIALVAVGTWHLFPRPDVLPWQDATARYGAENAVAAIVLGARLWDTLLEVLAYAMAMVGVRMAMRHLGRARPLPPVPETLLLTRSADILLGPILILSAYIAVSGHLGPGGGFPAGAILGSGLLLLALGGAFLIFWLSGRRISGEREPAHRHGSGDRSVGGAPLFCQRPGGGVTWRA